MLHAYGQLLLYVATVAPRNEEKNWMTQEEGVSRATTYKGPADKSKLFLSRIAKTFWSFPTFLLFFHLRALNFGYTFAG